jgi:hypothetical protein
VGTESGTVFSEVDLEQEAEWVDYDTKVRTSLVMLFEIPYDSARLHSRSEYRTLKVDGAEPDSYSLSV